MHAVFLRVVTLLETTLEQANTATLKSGTVQYELLA